LLSLLKPSEGKELVLAAMKNVYKDPEVKSEIEEMKF
jgi:hypothetical protein